MTADDGVAHLAGEPDRKRLPTGRDLDRSRTVNIDAEIRATFVRTKRPIDPPTEGTSR